MVREELETARSQNSVYREIGCKTYRNFWQWYPTFPSTDDITLSRTYQCFEESHAMCLRIGLWSARTPQHGSWEALLMVPSNFEPLVYNVHLCANLLEARIPTGSAQY